MYCFANGVNARKTAKVAHGEIVYKWLIFSSERCAKNSTNADEDPDEDDDEVENELVIVKFTRSSRVSLPLYLLLHSSEREKESKRMMRFASEKVVRVDSFQQLTPLSFYLCIIVCLK